MKNYTQKKDKTLTQGKKKNNYIKFLFKVVINWFKRLFQRISIYHRKGTHIITGYPGAGKTLLMSKIINSVDNSKYFFITNIDEFKQENVLHYNVFGMFENSKQVKKLPTTDYKGRKLYGLILDEINLKYNKRLNRSKDYNDSFVGLIELIITHRHQNIPRIYFIGQKLDLQDTQLQSLFKYYHNIVYNKQKPSYDIYKIDDKIIYVPKILYIENYIKSFNDEYLQEQDELSEVKIKYKDLSSYETLGLMKDYEKLENLEREKRV